MKLYDEVDSCICNKSLIAAKMQYILKSSPVPRYFKIAEFLSNHMALMKTALLTCILTFIVAIESFKLEILYDTIVHSQPQYLSFDYLSIAVNPLPSEFFWNQSYLCNAFVEFILITPTGELVLSKFQDTAEFQVDHTGAPVTAKFQFDRDGELEVITFDGKKNHKFYVCQEEHGQTIRSLGDLDEISKDCQKVSIIESGLRDRSIQLKNHATIRPFQLEEYMKKANRHSLSTRMPSILQSLFDDKNQEPLLKSPTSHKRVLILDSYGWYSSALCAEGLARGYQINIIVTSPDVIVEDLRSQITMFQGEKYSMDVVNEALKNVDAVISTMFVAKTDGSSSQQLVAFYEKLVVAMKQHGVQRIISLGAAQIGDQEASARGIFEDVKWRVATRIYKTVFSQMQRLVDIIKTSGLEFTIFKLYSPVGDATDMPTPYRVELKTQSKGHLSTSRANVVNFIYRELSTLEWMYEAPVIHDI
ncbi:hypothetical protein NEOLI_003800 [Neolecta irregularis DAH-3]|uniref:NAD(P)-binding domain-containing protein n=1 Tax=Neolecta irregularis (strain DAH-3) TaxID=1198029 RepID=A0A1U7LUI3_NEOID|nr:hypothetical protein NEOLI_003800 [Neolecta irregularis DAH-3]|eukprot:OLL26202.1 hypothetical protein NEOLI_003800 [Neolecta irregularis DAH-3]